MSDRLPKPRSTRRKPRYPREFGLMTLAVGASAMLSLTCCGGAQPVHRSPTQTDATPGAGGGASSSTSETSRVPMGTGAVGQAGAAEQPTDPTLEQEEVIPAGAPPAPHSEKPRDLQE